MSFLKFSDQTQGNGRGRLFWYRAEQDGAPFRGQQAPLLREEEFEEVAQRVWDCRYGTFDTSQPEQKFPENSADGRTLQFILEAVANGWFRIMSYSERWSKDKHGKPVMFVFVAWGEPYQEIPTKKA